MDRHFFADLHIHSRFSRGTSKHLTIDSLAKWAAIKGIEILGTGDFTHSGWLEEIREKLEENGDGTFSLKKNFIEKIRNELPHSVKDKTVKFIISGEISTIYKKKGAVRKIHHVVCLPSLESAEKIRTRLKKIGNLDADGRPILGLDSKHLAHEILDAEPQALIFPAHIWTPWFSVLGSRSGFDSIEECYEDLTSHIYAVETGLSSDPEMNWRVSFLDRFRLVSFSDSHSVEKIGREATVFSCDTSYPSILEALKTGSGYVGTVEFFPEEGKYHLDGHRKCGVRLTPEETKALNGICPECGNPLTVGVMHRVVDLADRTTPEKPETGGEVLSLVPLQEIIAEVMESGVKSKTVSKLYFKMIEELGPELFILTEAQIKDIERSAGDIVAEAIRRLRKGEVIREPGYDGEYGIIRLFHRDELKKLKGGGTLFDISFIAKKTPPRDVKPATSGSPAIGKSETSDEKHVPHLSDVDIFSTLDENQKKAAIHRGSPLIVIAGPGSGKTRVLTARIIHALKTGIAPESILAVTFTRKACDEIRERLKIYVPENADRINVHTFHSLAIEILRNFASLAGFTPEFRIIFEWEKKNILSRLTGEKEEKVNKILKRLEKFYRTFGESEGELFHLAARYENALKRENMVDLNMVIPATVKILKDHPDARKKVKNTFKFIVVDEFQDTDRPQYELLKLIAGDEVCVIGDPDQAIYSFRGASPQFFEHFKKDFPGAVEIRLPTNYRSKHFIQEAGARVMGHDVNISPNEEEKIILYSALTPEQEAEFIVSKIEELLEGHTFFSIDSGRGQGGKTEYHFTDIAIFYRTDRITGPLEKALKRSGIPFRKHTPEAVTEREDVRECLMRIEKMHAEKPHMSLEDIVEEVIKSLDHKKENTQEISLIFEKALEKSNGNFSSFLEEISLMKETDILDDRAGYVSLLTLHSAKGLEFPVVFIMGCEDSIIPLRWGKESENFDEEKRLFYVGITRAKEHLILTWSRKRTWPANVREMKPSPFIQLIPEKLINRIAPEIKKRRKKENSQLSLF